MISAEPPSVKVVVLLLENSQGQVLLTQRKKNQHLAGYWEFPGGKIESGESTAVALQRECKEELDYNVTTTNQVLQVHQNYPSFNVELRVFHEINPNPRVIAAENQHMQWVKKADLKLYKLPEANQSILNYLQAETD